MTEWLQNAKPWEILLPVVLVVAVFAVVNGAGDGEEPPVESEPAAAPAEPEPEPEEEGPDVLSEAACRHFRNVAGDIGDGVLTVDEIRDKMIEVREDGQYSDVPAIADASTALVAAVTRDDGEAFLQAVEDMSDACGSVGL